MMIPYQSVQQDFSSLIKAQFKQNFTKIFAAGGKTNLFNQLQPANLGQNLINVIINVFMCCGLYYFRLPLLLWQSNAFPIAFETILVHKFMKILYLVQLSFFCIILVVRFMYSHSVELQQSLIPCLGLILLVSHCLSVKQQCC
ncbi:Hypothetical_protein [Hexamita inflata]|uniref:Hypothetical_protein n=1 Tax=Hexamita inflata TaxID=28002 RepID=A0AA86NJN2_9EUKA|nr:Hypothetical protein HINF_LOCUS8859 [Hexamita inflata]